MSTERTPVSGRHLDAVQSSGLPLFDLGEVVATPAVLAHLEKHGIYPPALLGRHVHGDWGDVDDEDAKANNGAIKSGARIVSAYSVEGEVIFAITEAQTVVCNAKRPSTCLLFASEY